MNHQNALIEVLPQLRHALRRKTAVTKAAKRQSERTTTMAMQLTLTMMTAAGAPMTERSQTKRATFMATGCGDAEAAEQDVSIRA